MKLCSKSCKSVVEQLCMRPYTKGDVVQHKSYCLCSSCLSVQKGASPVNEHQLVENEPLTVGELMVIHYKKEEAASGTAGDGDAANEPKKNDSECRACSAACLNKRAREP